MEEGSRVVERTYDLVVLSVGMLPAYDPQAVYQVPVSDDGFVAIPAANLLPCETERPGIFVTGTAAGPMDIVDSIVMAGAASAEAAAYIEAHQNGQAVPVTLDERWEPIHA
jgi:heterodisulfide reductase subunit A